HPVPGTPLTPPLRAAPPPPGSARGREPMACGHWTGAPLSCPALLGVRDMGCREQGSPVLG
ncbi:MAG: hypothetical protein ACLP1X_06570, partial [Polyangiaceae bacterium]